MLTVADVVGWFEDAYPPALAESWDRVGLSVGDPDAPVSRILFAVDVTDEVVTQAAGWGADLIVAHHPLLLRGVHSLRTDEPKGRVVSRLIQHGIAVFSAHTNADAAMNGVADALAGVLGLGDLTPLVPQADGLLGLGRIGTLPTPMPATQVAETLAEGVPRTAGGIKLGGDPDRVLSRIAVLGGAGNSLLEEARSARVDAYITGDLRHHPAQDFLAHRDAPVLIDVPHWAAEWTWLPHAERFAVACAAREGEALATTVSELVTDPWVLRFG